MKKGRIAAAYNAAHGALQCLFSHKRTLAQNVSAGAVVDAVGTGSARAVQPGRALAFASAAYLSVPVVASLGTADFTIETDAIFDSFAAAPSIFYFGNNAATNRIQIYTNSIGALVLGIDDGSGFAAFTLTVTPLLATAKYRLKIVILRSATATLYVNNAFVKSIDISGKSAPITATRCDIGSALGGNLLVGKLYNYSVSIGAANVFTYPMSEVTGTTAYDISGNGYHGTHIGGVTHATFTDGSGTDTNNQHGYTLSGGVFIPLTPASGYTMSATGAAATVTGRVQYNATQTGHDGTNNGVHSGMTVNLNPIGAPELANAGIPLNTTVTHGAALPPNVTADIDGAGIIRNIRVAS
jgi:hypothetical protein